MLRGKNLVEKPHGRRMISLTRAAMLESKSSEDCCWNSAYEAGANNGPVVDGLDEAEMCRPDTPLRIRLDSHACG